MTLEGISSGMARTVSGVVAAEAAAVEEQRAPLADLHRHHVAGDQLVVAAVEDVAQAALDDRQRMVDDRRSRDAVGPADALELVAARDGEGAAQCLLVFTENVHAERARLRDAGPARGAAGGTQDHHGRVERERREGLARKPDRHAVLQRGDDGDPGGEVAEHLAEPGLVEARHVYALPRSIDWDSCAEDTSSTSLASGSRRAWFKMRSSSRSVCEGSWCESSSRFALASAATCTAYAAVEWPQSALAENSSSVY